MFTTYHVSVAFSALLALLCLRVLLHDPRRIQNQVFFAIGLAVAVFTGSIYLSFLYPERPDITTPLNRISVIFTAIVTSLLLYFSLVFPTVHVRRKRLAPVLILAPALGILLLGLLDDLFVARMVVHEEAGGLVMDRQTGPLYRFLYAPLVMFNIGGAIVGFVIQYRRSTTHIERKQLAYTAIGMAGGGVAATITCIVLPLLGYPEFYVMGPAIGTPVFILVMVYNFLTFKAMDVDQLLSTSVLWVLSLCVSALPFGLVTYVLLRNTERFTVVTGTLFMLLGLGFVYGYQNLVQPAINRRLKRKVHDYRRLIQRFNLRILKLTKLQDLLTSVTDLLTETLQPRSISFLLQGVGRGEYTIISDARDLQRQGSLTLSTDRTRYIVENAEVLEREQLEMNPVYAPEIREAGKRYLKAFDAEVSVPLVFEGRLIGAINLGPRQKGYYGRIEIEFLDNLRTGMNVALSNSMLLKDIENINTAYERFVPREMLSFLGAESIVDVGLGDHTEVEMTVLFADIRAFTELSEEMTPDENFRFINAYLHHIGPVARRHNGFIDKYIGDAVMALFPSGPDDAIRAAREMMRVLRDFNVEEARAKPIDIGIGIHTGVLMLGTIGEARRMEATVIADAVNLASRLEGLTRTYGVHIITSEQALAGVADPSAYPHRHLGTVQVKGKRRAVEIYEILVEDEAPSFTEAP